MRLRALITTALASTAVAVTLGGCGSSAVVAGPLTRAAYVTGHASGAHMQLSATIESAALPQPVSMSGAGYFNFASREGSLSIQLTGLPETALGSAPTMQEILTGSDVYVGSPAFTGKLPGGASWIKVDLTKAEQAAGLDPSQLLQGQANPAQFLEYLKASGSSVTIVGHEAVRGVPTTRYAAEIDLGKLASSMAGANSATVQKAIAALGVSEIPVDVWVDSQDLVRRLQLAFHANAGGQSMQMQMNLELFDFGTIPHVSVPAASETFDATSATLGSLGSASQ